jgi:hypothetical protein
MRIGRASTSDEVAAWPDTEYRVLGKIVKSWLSIVELVLDPQQGAYRTEDLEARRLHDEPNDVWHAVAAAFVEEEGIMVLSDKIDAAAFSALTPDKVT